MMQDRALLPQGGQVYKANLHCHTVLSDGHWTKEQVKAEYQKRGYSIVAFTDHRHYGWHPELMDAHFIPLAAYEADLNEPFPASGSFERVRTYHLNFYDTAPQARSGFAALPHCSRWTALLRVWSATKILTTTTSVFCTRRPAWRGIS